MAPGRRPSDARRRLSGAAALALTAGLGLLAPSSLWRGLAFLPPTAVAERGLSAAAAAAAATEVEGRSGLRRPAVLSTLAAALGVSPVLPVQPAGALFGLNDFPAPPDAAEPPPDAVRTKSGLAYKVLTPAECSGSDCKRPTKFDKVYVDYTGWQSLDGKMFDSSVQRGKPANFGVGQVIKGWTEGLQLMSPGAKFRFWIPARMAYGENPDNGRPGGLLVFDVELIDIERGITPPPAPPDVEAAPADAARSPSGIAWKVLTPGKPGFESFKVEPESSVTLEYSGWKADGELILSTKLTGKTAKFVVKDFNIKGLAEVVMLMSLGEQRRVWIPAKLAFGESPGGGLPGGPLVFDVKLAGIQ
mmetsp:Transcript_138057/g.441010  ORF Transcript_138057/g.441010 Transcript_138057/m.441010 type:complete len:360 (+) Transcript_138057:107-1186(+)|eukprot:CAMPEP_0203906146 /NCGR_PEP_ID=MMETSP0359-20131031/47810_1 /ASSEMBLY_ACC=CAM_ASM_000338 /TAXON_ID=268821 /ORGANISM="Scrippsiella Hangoei, Strain SHTV-5" /LENGTH=359 /DNA_ID=CAMNT_0050830739 /DNA_START=30 /DNA_END=1109 /DNA_ORIENTATION=+